LDGEFDSPPSPPHRRLEKRLLKPFFVAPDGANSPGDSRTDSGTPDEGRSRQPIVVNANLKLVVLQQLSWSALNESSCWDSLLEPDNYVIFARITFAFTLLS